MDKGLQSLGMLTFLRSYSKDGIENYADTVERYLQFFRDRFPQYITQINGYGQAIHEEKCVGSQRLMQFAGEAASRNNERAYNCCFNGLESFKDFADVCYLLCCGCGVGASVEDHYIHELPCISEGHECVFVVPDTKEGWADSFYELLNNPKTVFDYSLVRPAGAKLSSGGTASGWGPLKEAHNRIRDILTEAINRQLASSEAADVVCLIAQAVVSGGSRRSAIILLTSPYDELMSKYKSEGWWDSHPWRAKANISAVCLRNTPEVEFVIDEQLASPFGERGIVLVDKRDRTANVGINPCSEISLKHRTFCNLSSIVLPNCGSLEDFYFACQAAAFFGTLQATLTDFSYIHPDWKCNSEEERLIGVSLNGVAQAPKWVDEQVLRHGANEVCVVNSRWANKLGINPAKRCTTIKPEGSSAARFGCTSGMHSAYFQYGVRRIRITKLSVLAQRLIAKYGISNGQATTTEYGTNILPTDKYSFIVPECYSDKDIVLQFPCNYANAIYRKDETAIDALERAKSLYHNWIIPGHRDGQETNNISQTLNFHPHEKETVKEWMLSHQRDYRAISTLPYDCTAYALLPFEELSYEEYLKYLERFPAIEWEDFGVTSEVHKTSACSGGGCEVT